ncbi:response regulator transcription factor [Sphingomonas sp. PAMC 26621]|uniref:response regulator transcription factor n=1 Tax=Sphingomonas sp. PAMC 26621 TaxID=1112213 RepID=UPI00028A1A7D|nr:response regulator transcription factor [Sphingomonas sp. PAMC 26621]
MARIIIVDDDEIMAEIVSEALEAAGHLVSAVHDGFDAMEAISRGDPDLLVLDYNLPGRTGMDILREIRASPRAEGLPIIMVTAHGGRLLMIRADQTGADDYIIKPFAPAELVQRAEALLLSSRITRAALRL